MQNNISTTAGADMAKEFMSFIKKFGVIGLAIGSVVGAAVTKLVAAITTNIVSPIINKILANLGGLKAGQTPNFGVEGLDIGSLISGFIDFAALMFIVFFAVKFLLSKFVSKEELDAMK
jgi:large conductance mechanosensitive channel